MINEHQKVGDYNQVIGGYSPGLPLSTSTQTSTMQGRKIEAASPKSSFLSSLYEKVKQAFFGVFGNSSSDDTVYTENLTQYSTDEVDRVDETSKPPGLLSRFWSQAKQLFATDAPIDDEVYAENLIDTQTTDSHQEVENSKPRSLLQRVYSSVKNVINSSPFFKDSEPEILDETLTHATDEAVPTETENGFTRFLQRAKHIFA